MKLKRLTPAAAKKKPVLRRKPTLKEKRAAKLAARKAASAEARLMADGAHPLFLALAGALDEAPPRRRTGCSRQIPCVTAWISIRERRIVR